MGSALTHTVGRHTLVRLLHSTKSQTDLVPSHLEMSVATNLALACKVKTMAVTWTDRCRNESFAQNLGQREDAGSTLQFIQELTMYKNNLKTDSNFGSIEASTSHAKSEFSKLLQAKQCGTGFSVSTLTGMLNED